MLGKIRPFKSDMSILDANLLKCNLLQATVENRHRDATRRSLTARGAATWAILIPLQKRLTPTARYLDETFRAKDRPRDLTTGEGGLKYRQFPAKSPAVRHGAQDPDL